MGMKYIPIQFKNIAGEDNLLKQAKGVNNSSPIATAQQNCQGSEAHFWAKESVIFL